MYSCLGFCGGGGLGVKESSCFNGSLLSEWGWRFTVKDKGLWRMQIEFAYHKKTKLSSSSKSHKRFFNFWKEVVKVSSMFWNHVKQHIRDGKKTFFWKDPWILDAPLMLIFSNFYARSSKKNGRISKFFNRRRLTWKFRLFNTLLVTTQRQYSSPLPLLQSIILCNEDDKIVWRVESNGTFSCASHYSFAISRGVRCQLAPSLWSAHLSLKVKYFLWLRQKKRLNTRDLIQQKYQKELG